MNGKKELEFKDQLRVEGILSKGFGHIAKFVATDTDLTLEALAIYSYFSSYAGGGDTSFPSRKKIIYDLGIGKNRYYNHYNLLLKEGYIKAEQERYYNETKKKWVLGNNIYTLVSNPKKFEEQSLSKDKHKEKAYSRLRNSGMKSLGYGTIPKSVMLDKRLSIQAKGIYAYFCSFAGSGNSAFPEVENILYHLQISEDTYYKYYKELIKANYIEVVQRQIKGKKGVNDYYLNENPDEIIGNKIANEMVQKRLKSVNKPNLPTPKNRDTENRDTENRDTENRDTENRDTENKDTYITNRTNTNRTNTNRTNTNSFNINSHSFNQDKDLSKKEEETDFGIKEIERLNPIKLKEIIKKELKEERTIPYRYTQSNRVMEFTIKILTEYDFQIEWYKENKDNVGVDIFYIEALKLFNEALSEMLTTQDNMFLKGSVVTYSKIYDRLVEGIEINENYISIGSVLDNSITDYRKASSQEEIYSPLNYMKSVIWNALLVGDIKVTSDIERTFGNGKPYDFY